jgi:hypothetical protein
VSEWIANRDQQGFEAIGMALCRDEGVPIQYRGVKPLLEE